MKRGTKLVALLAVLVILAGAAAAVRLLTPEQTQEDTTAVIFESESITGISWTYDDQTLAFHAENGAWQYTADSSFPLDTDALEAVVRLFDQIVSYRTIKNVQDLAQYGLQAPARTVSVTTAAGTTQILLGNTTAVDGRRYCSIGDGNVYLVASQLFTDSSVGLYDLISLETIPNMAGVSAVTVSRADGSSLQLVAQEQEGKTSWTLQGSDAVLDQSRTKSLISKITGVSWEKCVCYNAAGDLLTQYGLETPTVTVTVQYGEQFVLELGAVTQDAQNCYARLGGSSMVYLVDAALLEALQTASPESLAADTE